MARTPSPRWGRQERIHHLGELRDEIRYYRGFHHTVFTISTTLYVGLIVLQADVLKEASRDRIVLTEKGLIALEWVIPIVMLVLLPGIFTYMFVNWHFVQGSVRDLAIRIQKELGFPEEFQEAKYDGFSSKCWQKRFATGKGHILFIGVLWLLVAVNFIVFIMLSEAIQGPPVSTP